MAFGMLYLDESGHFSESPYVCMAGYMATDEGWSQLCDGWRYLLHEKYKIPAIHMRELMSPKSKSPASQWDMPRKVEMIRAFAMLVRKHTEVGFACAIDAKHYRAVVEEIKKVAHGAGLKVHPFSAQTFCMARIISLLLKYLNDINASEDERKTSLIFDDDEHYSKQCYSLLVELKKRVPRIKETIVNICFADDLNYYPLQAADLLSYATCNELKKGADAWKETNVYTDLLKAEAPAFGKQYYSEMWGDDQASTEALMQAIALETIQFPAPAK